MIPTWLKYTVFLSPNVTQYLLYIIKVYNGPAEVLSSVPLTFCWEILIINKIMTVEKPKYKFGKPFTWLNTFALRRRREIKAYRKNAIGFGYNWPYILKKKKEGVLEAKLSVFHSLKFWNWFYVLRGIGMWWYQYYPILHVTKLFLCNKGFYSIDSRVIFQ